MRWMAAVLTLALLATAVPTAQANTGCTHEQVVPIDGLVEASVTLCDRTGDRVPDRYEILIPLYDLELSGTLDEDRWGGDERFEAETGLTAGYPVAPTAEARVSAIDEGRDSSWDRFYVSTIATAALPTEPGVGLFIGVQDKDGDGVYEEAYVDVCDSQRCVYAAEPFYFIGLLLDLVPPSLWGVIGGAEVPGAGDVLPENLP